MPLKVQIMDHTNFRKYKVYFLTFCRWKTILLCTRHEFFYLDLVNKKVMDNIFLGSSKHLFEEEAIGFICECHFCSSK